MVETPFLVGKKLSQNEPVFQLALRDLRTGLRQIYDTRMPSVVLYGSYARNEAHEESDIDVLLLFSEDIRPGAEITRVSQLLADLNLHYEVLISVVPTTQNRYQSAEGPFWKNVRREGIEIHGF